jgi:hypothetical protein
MPLRPITVGSWIERSRWPRHVTVCPNFRCGPNDVDALAAVLRRVTANISLPAATVGENAEFGPGEDVPVQLVESCDLQRLHVTLMDALRPRFRSNPSRPDTTGRFTARTLQSWAAHWNVA